MHYLAFLGLAALLVAIPGPAILLVSTATARQGLGAGVATSLGVFAADLVWVAASVAGVTAVLVASTPAFLAIRYAGAAYLLYLGVRLLLARGGHADDEAAAAPRHRVGAVAAFRRGVLCDLSNPKTVLVFTSVLPPFLGPHSGPADVLLLGTTFALVGLVSLAVYVGAAAGARRAVSPRATRLGAAARRVAGGALVLFGIGLVAEPVS